MTTMRGTRVAKFMGASAVALALAGRPSPANAADYYVDAAVGSDVTGDGTAANPWKSITHSIEQASAGDLWAAAGVYDEANGERFPLNWAPFSSPLSISLHGSTTGTTLIRGGIGAYCVGLLRSPGLRAASPSFDHLYLQASPTDSGVGFSDKCDGMLAVSDSVIDGFNVGHSIAPTGPGMCFGFPYDTASHLANNVYRNNGTGLALTVGEWVPCPGMLYTDWSVIENNLFIDNDIAIGLFPTATLDGSTALYTQIRNNTIVGSTTYGIQVDSSALPDVLNTPTIVNNIIAFGSGYGIYDPVAGAGDPAVIDYNAFYDNALGDMFRGVNAGTNNQFADPQFVDRSGFDFHLATGSPCIDGGSNVGAPDIDLEYVPRPVDGDGDTVVTADIGCYEMPRRLAGVDLRRADFVDAMFPDKAAAFPFDASNPRTPVVIVEFVSGEADPTPGILDDPAVPLAFYQLDPSPGRVLYAVKDAAGGTVRFETR